MTVGIIGGLIGAGVAPDRIRVADPDPARQKALGEAHSVAVTGDNAEALAGADVAVLPVRLSYSTSIASSPSNSPLR